ncbi:hypothetical protein C1I95_25450 [Micromonospora craterilacus]|uniref:Uncharacterized protein n=1 Tax=Micromonospora craterilacus TaxID=1655439 RepID=A0A2W2ET67_9ACTN|nr:hypothetical protein [Micromonospora craterilacus]PZG12577.1 hypothetical protein C1I95_25450 [Micromonospora craterilacus]
MIEQVEPRVPMPVAVAVLIMVLVIAGSVGETLTTPPFGVTELMLPVLFLALAYGLWRRSGRARFWTTVFLMLAVVQDFEPLWLLRMAGAAVIVGLLLVPASSRRWFGDIR